MSPFISVEMIGRNDRETILVVRSSGILFPIQSYMYSTNQSKLNVQRLYLFPGNYRLTEIMHSPVPLQWLHLHKIRRIPQSVIQWVTVMEQDKVTSYVNSLAQGQRSQFGISCKCNIIPWKVIPKTQFSEVQQLHPPAWPLCVQVLLAATFALNSSATTGPRSSFMTSRRNLHVPG